MPLLQTPLYEEQHQETSTHKRPQLYLSPVKGAIHINEVKVITARAPACLRILNTLIIHRWHDCRAGLSPEDYTYLNIFKIADALEEEGVSITDIESLRRILNRAIQFICMRLNKELGLNIEGKDIIEMKRWRGFKQKEEFGYRLTPLTLFLKI